jgi:DNA-binding MarR family transcriptional regulator
MSRVSWEQPELGLEPGTVDLAYQFLVASHQLMRVSKRRMGDVKLSIPRVQVLLALADARLRMDDHLRMRDLAEELGVTPRNITTIVDGLEREGLLARRPDPGDRRAVWLELTPLGVSSIDQIHRLEEDISARFFAPLDAEQRRQLGAILRMLCCGAGETGPTPASHAPTEDAQHRPKLRGRRRMVE